MNLLQEYAKLIIRQGVNLQKGQPLIINAPIECADLVRLLTKEAYTIGADKVHVEYIDNQLMKLHYLNQTINDDNCSFPFFCIKIYSFSILKFNPKFIN